MAFTQPDDSAGNNVDETSNSSSIKEEGSNIDGQASSNSYMNSEETSNSGHAENDNDAADGESGEGAREIKVEPDTEAVKKRKLDDLNDESAMDDPDSSPSKKPHLDKEVRRLLPDLEKFWSTIEQDPNDFTAWTHLLQYVDQVSHMSVASEAYDAFLMKYPYCYGYWKKYADYAKRRGSALEVQQIFTRGLTAIPLSVDLWIHYLTYVRSTRQDDEDLIRSKYEQGIESCGLEFRSDKFWDQYVQWEIETNHLRNAMIIWDQIIKTPMQSLKKHFEKMVEFINEHEVSEILSEDEFSTLLAEIGEIEGDEDQTTKLRSKVIEKRTKIYENTLNEIKIRSSFEDGIKRPYFHVKPVEKNQLKNWMEYLDFEIGKGDLKRIITLFERCLIACAMYAEYWEKFLKFLQSQSPLDIPKIEEVFVRVTAIHHPKIYKFNLDFAAFEEKIGNLEKASEIFEDVIATADSAPLPLYYRHIQFERRRQNLSRCSELYEKYIKHCADKKLSLHLSVKYARFLNQYLKAYGRAVELLKSILDEDASIQPKVLMALVDLGLHASPMDSELILFAFDYGLKGKENRLTFAQRKLEFLEDYGGDIEKVQIAQDELQSIMKTVKEEQNHKPDPIVNSVKITNSEALKIVAAPIVETQVPVGGGGYDYNNGSGGGYSQDYGQYDQGQYSSTWNAQAPVAAGDPSVYGQSYVNQPSSWNNFYA